MNDVMKSIFITILCVEFILGNLGNGFIVLVNCIEWVKRRKISLVDKILTGLAVSRINVLWSVLMVILSVFYPNFVMSIKMFNMIVIFWRVTGHLSIWLATCLSIFYFLKIATFFNSIFLYLKWRVEKVMSMMLLVSLISLFFNIVLIDTHMGVFNFFYNVNMSCRFNLSTYAEFPKQFLLSYAISSLIPFIVSLTSFLLLIFSLWKHRMKVQHNNKRSRDVSTAAHVKAMQTVIAFLMLYTIFFLSLLVQVLKTEFLGKIFFALPTQAAEIAFPAGHSFVLILGNNKLRQTFILMLKWLTCRDTDVKSTGS